jgi:hypothetical protein
VSFYCPLSLYRDFHRNDDRIDPFRYVEFDQMPQHFGLDVNLQPRRMNIDIVPDHSGRPVVGRKAEILVGLREGGDVDRETVELLRLVPDGQRIRGRADALENGILQMMAEDPLLNRQQAAAADEKCR